jgi:hypothetical protein
MPLQRKLPLDETPALVLADVAAARMALPGHDEDDILAMIEDGQLAYAWNIGLGTAREIRIYPPCVEHYRRTGGSRQFNPAEPAVLAELLSRNGEKPFIKSSVLRLILNCGSTHLINLIEAKALRVVPNTTWGTGPNGAALVTIDSLKTFLQTRRLP